MARSSSKPTRRPAPRAPRAEGPRTTLRVPDELAATAERLADELGISRNDALLRLASRGAGIYEMEQRIAERRVARWAAVFPHGVDLDDADPAGFPTPEEVEAALLGLEAESPDA